MKVPMEGKLFSFVPNPHEIAFQFVVCLWRIQEVMLQSVFDRDRDDAAAINTT